MDSTGIPPEGLTEGAKTLLQIVPVLMTIALPFVTKLIDKWGFLDKIPTNFISLGLAIVLTFGFKFLLAPDLQLGGVIALVAIMGYGGTLLHRTAKAITNPK